MSDNEDEIKRIPRKPRTAKQLAILAKGRAARIKNTKLKRVKKLLSDDEIKTLIIDAVKHETKEKDEEEEDGIEIDSTTPTYPESEDESEEEEKPKKVIKKIRKPPKIEKVYIDRPIYQQPPSIKFKEDNINIFKN